MRSKYYYKYKKYKRKYVYLKRKLDKKEITNNEIKKCHDQKCGEFAYMKADLLLHEFNIYKSYI
jgi:hypothetical protein